MQDVKLVAGSNGHLAQCPSAEPDCPTCGQFQTLQSVVARLEKSLQQLTDKVMISFAFCFASLVTIRRRNFLFVFVLFRRLLCQRRPICGRQWRRFCLALGRISFAMQQSVIVTDIFTGRLLLTGRSRLEPTGDARLMPGSLFYFFFICLSLSPFGW